MANTNIAKSALPYARQLIEDDYVREQLREAISSLRKVAAAAKDSEPKAKPRRRLRKVVILSVAVGGTVLLTIMVQKQQSGNGTSPAAA